MYKNKGLSKLKMKKYSILFSVSILLTVLFVFLMAAWANNTVNIYDGDSVLSIKTKQSTVSQVLQEASISLGDFDRVEPSLDENVHNNMDIRISRAVLLSVSDGGVAVEYYSSAKTVEGVLNQTGHTLGEYDRIVPDMSAPVTAGMQIEILRAVKFYICDENGEREIYSCAATVGELAKEQGLYQVDGKSLNLPYDVKLKEGMKLKVSSVDVTYEDVTESIGYSCETRQNSSLPQGETRVTQQGSNGTKVVTYEIRTKDGEQTERVAVNTTVTKEPVTKIIEQGTGTAASSKSSSGSTAKKTSASATSAKTSSPTSTSSNSSKGFNYSKVLTCSATAYDLSYESCGKHPGDSNYGVTASGMKAQYGVIAVDPSVIPLGTRLYIENNDGSWAYGYCVAGDTGGGISGNRVDLFFNSRAEALQFGRRQVKVYILK